MKIRRILAGVICVVLGVVLICLSGAEITDEYWSGMGGALIAVGIMRTIQFYRFRKDDTYREKVETELSDERNRFIRNKAWAWSGYLFILIAAVASIVLRVLGEELLSNAAGLVVCLMIVLYWISFIILRRKY